MKFAGCNEPIASNINRIILEKKLNQVEVAGKINCTPRVLHEMISGRILIKHCDVNYIAYALGVAVNELYEEV